MKSILHLALLLALMAAPAFAQARSKRLILKDGSYQSATKWEVKADRVRYFSAERYMWEELPTSLVDWTATEKFEKDVASGRIKNDADDPDPSVDTPDEPEPPTVAPGLQLPDAGGIFMLDRFKEQPRLVEVIQNGSEINQERGKNILRAVINPIPSGPKQTVELRGLKASVQSHTLQPEFFINVNFDEHDDASAPKLPPGFDRFRVIRLQKKDKDKLRIVSNLKYSLLGNVKEQRELVPTKSEQLAKDWIKITPLQPLPPGEYAVVEMVSDKQMNLYVWDFGVDPKAPANRMTWSPRTVEKTETGTKESPVLKNKRQY
ncbi:MAG TPA: hypothetical protein VMZ25_09720 [Terriglobales bacterium]|nr:hypothetical protein [Terriglobales bacterium]